MKKQKFIINHGTYPFDIIVFIDYKYDDVIKYLQKLVKLNEHEKEDLKMDGIGRTCSLHTGQTIIRINYIKDNFFNTVAHEIFHAVEFLFNHINIDYSNGKVNEAFAYQIGYLTKQFFNKLKK